MKKSKWVLMAAGMIFIFSGCATMKESLPKDADRTAQAFFDDLQRSNYEGAYGLLGRGLSQRLSFDQFDGFMQTLREQWGRLDTDETAVMPFHRRVGESNFIPMHASPQEIKRYVYNVHFENAEMNFDLTLAPEDDGYKIVWFSIWGSSIYLTPKIQEKMENLFSHPENSGQ
jgi:hypothetical protein